MHGMTLDDLPGACATPDGLWYGGGLVIIDRTTTTPQAHKL